MSDRFSRRDRSHKGFQSDDRYQEQYAPPPRGGFEERSSNRDRGRMTMDAQEMEATVKWFNPAKGFGFAELSDGSGDAFLGARALEALGHATIDPGARLKVAVSPGQRGPQVSQVIEVLSSGTPERPARSSGGGGFADRNDRGPTRSLNGTVKWFNPDKGFGFVAVNGGPDIFLHASALRRSGISDIQDATPVRMEVFQGKKGEEVFKLELA